MSNFINRKAVDDAAEGLWAKSKNYVIAAGIFVCGVLFGLCF